MTTLYRTNSLRGKWLFIALMALTCKVSAKSKQDGAALVTLKINRAPIEDANTAYVTEENETTSFLALAVLSRKTDTDQDSARITLNESNISVEDALLKIEAQTGVTIFYAKQHLSGKEILTKVSLHNVKLNEALSIVLSGKGVIWKIKDGGVTIIKKNEERKDGKHLLIGDTIPRPSIKGTVTSDEGFPMIGATVQVKGTALGTTTDKHGQFSINSVETGSVIIVSFTGYQPQEFKAVPPEVLVVKLKKNVESLDEQVVIAYGTSTRRKLTGAVSRITGADISKQPVSNPLAAMIGRLPGVQITQNTGVPGGDFTVQIRGRNSISQGNEPFYIVDGVPFSGKSISSGLSTIVNGGSPLNYINPVDIESIEVLKDADATAIYGSRGANGVVLITTKQGKIGKTKVDVNFYQGIGMVPHFMKLLDTDQYLEMRNEAFLNDGIAVTPTTPNTDDLKWGSSRYTNWQKELIGGRANFTDAQASISGGNAGTKFLIGAGMHRETTVFPSNSADNKVSFRFNIHHNSQDQKFKLQFSGNYVDDNNNLIRTDFTKTALTLPPNAPALFQSNGGLNWENSTWTNPMSTIEREYSAKASNIIGNASLSYEVIKNLDVRLNLGYTAMRLQEITTLPFSSFDPSMKPATTNTNFNDNGVKTWVVEPQIEYRARLGGVKISGLLGSTFQQNFREGELLIGDGYLSDALLKDMKSASIVSVFSTTFAKYRYNAIFGRVNFDWNDKYILNITGRRDGSSRFGPGSQFANFGAVGAAWIFSNEKFIKQNIDVLSFGKIRGSLGTTGNDQILDYGFIDLWQPTLYPYLGTKGVYSNTLFNPNYAWEVNKKIEGAVELGFWANRIYLMVSHYRNRSGNQLVGNPLPTMTGFNSVTANREAIVENTGWEMEMTSVNFKTGFFKWTTGINLTIPQSKLVSLPGFEKSTTFPLLYAIGYPLNVAKAYVLSGVNQQTGVYEFIKSAGGVTSTPSLTQDRTLALSLMPEYYGGLQNSISVKNYSFDFLFQFTKQTGLNYLGEFSLAPGFISNQPIEVLGRWRKAGEIASVQRFSQSTSSLAYRAYSNVNSSGSNKYSDASFVRLKNVSISYQLPELIRAKVRASNIRLYIQGQNIFTITRYKGLDPETMSFSRLPTLRVLTVGIQVLW